MAISRQRRNIAYGVGQPLYDIPTQPVSSTRAPTTSDMAELGTIWVRKSTNAAWVLASIVSNSATWTPMTVNAGATITTGDLTVTAGDVIVTAGDITATAGDIVATAGAVEAGTTLTSGTGITATTGGVLASAGDIVATLGGITADAGDITATLGAVEAGTTVTAGTGITATTGDITASTGDLIATLGSVGAAVDILAVRILAAGGDDGTGTAGSTTLTNVVDTTLSTGAGVVLMKTANPGDSSGWMKIYVGTDVRYIPYWTNLSP